MVSFLVEGLLVSLDFDPWHGLIVPLEQLPCDRKSRANSVAVQRYI